MKSTKSASRQVDIKVIGLGGGGCNAVSHMVEQQIRGIDFIAVNTDVEALTLTKAPKRIQIGEKLTKGFGVGGDPEMGRKAAEESQWMLSEILNDADIVFITVGLGGGTGTGAAPIVSYIAKETEALTIAMVTRPFTFEGAQRNRVAEKGILTLRDKVDALIVIANDRLLTIYGPQLRISDAFEAIDGMLSQAVEAITDIITMPGLINLDLADLKAIMKDAGFASVSIGWGKGQNRATEAATAALNSTLSELPPVAGARGILFNVAGGTNLTLHEIKEAAGVIAKAAPAQAKILFGISLNEEMEDAIKITLIASGFTPQSLGPAEDVRALLPKE